jgi:hypothetical protein
VYGGVSTSGKPNRWVEVEVEVFVDVSTSICFPLEYDYGMIRITSVLTTGN